MASYLETGRYRLTIEECQYNGKWKVTKGTDVTTETDVQIATPSLGGLYISDQELSWTKEQDEPSAPGKSLLQKFIGPTINRIAQLRTQRDADTFLELYERWKRDQLILTRGITGTHMRWNDLVGGSLGSEGGTDDPTFTMGNANPTRWLPTSFFPNDEHAGAEGPALSDVNHPTTRQVLETYGGWVPAGMIVKINAGESKNFAICWLNEGEIAVRGPLSYAARDFSYWRIVYTDTTKVRLVEPPQANLLQLLQLLHQRPYQPEDQQAIEDWLANSVIEFHAKVQAQSGLDLYDPVDARH